ncbi:protein-tyrosine phosphatase family protein [Haloarcula marismortui]|uniref:Dual specificity protein phosphatase family protein n=1 Tax=Haloarcula marismortui ATCC 33800 TaxID=662476 RepID=A0A8T8KBX0_9EURY|nr:dual specificity protein phosphatase family protein [Haloarcula sinaiiensis]QUJ71407.1 dual specificity protein phosphatase family protein [Haloarcula sinaiiensis ATCC 33800]
MGENTAPSPTDHAVRPVGFVSDEPVIRQIGDRTLYLGNKHAARGVHDQSFEHVLSATSESYPLTTAHHPLIDGSGNEWAAFEAAVDTVRRFVRADGPALIHCKAGVSRSATLIATAIAAEETRPLSDALAAVRAARPIATPNPALYKLAVIYLAADESH